MIKNMNSKMTTNSQISTTEPKKHKQKLSKQLEQEQNHINGDHMEDYHREGERQSGGKGKRNKKHNWQVQNRQEDVKNSIGNGEAKKLTRTTHGHEISGSIARGKGDIGQKGAKGKKMGQL